MKSFSQLLIIFLWGVFSQLPAQELDKIDSLQHVLASPLDDVHRIHIHLALYNHTRFSDTLSAHTHIQKAMAISAEISHDSLLLWSKLSYAEYLLSEGKNEKSRGVLSDIEEYPTLNQFPVLQATHHQILGLVELAEGNYEPAADHFLQAESLFSSEGNTEGMRECYGNIGVVYWRMGDLDKALAYYLKDAYLGEREGDSISIASRYGNIGLIYRSKEVYDTALIYYQLSLEMFERLDKKISVAINLQNIGALYLITEDFSKAQSYFTRARELSEEINDKIGVLYASYSLANVEIKMGRFEKGIKGLRDALTLAEALEDKTVIKDLHKTLSKVYSDKGQFQTAYTHRLQYEFWKDSLVGEKHLRQVKELELQYETVKKDNQITFLTQENEIQQLEARRQDLWNKGLLLGIGLMAIIAGLIYYTYRQRLRTQHELARKNLQIKESYFQKELSQLEMKALRAQMNPHFVFNCLNSINRLILSGEDDQASHYLSKFSKLLRKILENAEGSRVTLSEEVSMLQTYIELEALRLKEEIQYKVQIDPNLDPEDIQIPSMVLQPLLENAIWHGILHKEGKGEISLSIQGEEENLLCKIEDNGVGREKALNLKEYPEGKTKSLGLQIIKDRLNLLGGSGSNFNPKFVLTDLKNTLNQATGTRVEITLPKL
ncbi:MAG: tetratricopeptide repeat protein [Bacteroidota bacterium]